MPLSRPSSSSHRLFYNVRPHPADFIIHDTTSCSIVLCVVRIGFVLYRNRLVLKQVTVQGFNLLHLFIRLSLFMVITVVGAAYVLSSKSSG
jgi:hypothetical protein